MKSYLNGTSVEWRVNTPALLKEIIEGHVGAGVFFQPINILKSILYEVAERAAELNDPVMNALMTRVAFYEISDPYSSGYDHEALTKVLSHPEYLDYKKKKQRKK